MNLLYPGTLNLSSLSSLWPSGLGNFIRKRFAAQALLWLMEFVIQIIIKGDTMAELTCICRQLLN